MSSHDGWNQDRRRYECPRCGCRRFEVSQEAGGKIRLFCSGCGDSALIGRLQPGGLSEGVHAGLHEEVESYSPLTQEEVARLMAGHGD